MCNNWPDFPNSVATGGLVGNTVIICGGGEFGSLVGGPPVDECYSLTSEKRTFVTQMSVARWDAASIVLNDNTLWVTGGYNDHWGRLSSTEYITMTGTMPGPNLPMALRKHVMVVINSTCSMVIGGSVGYEIASTFFYDRSEGEWIDGPSLIRERYDHAAGIVTDEVTNEHFVVVTGGYGFFSFLDSTEILQDGEWVQGKIDNTIYHLLEIFCSQNTITTFRETNFICQV